MKKTIITAAVVLLAILVATLFLGAGKQSRKLDADYELSFAGRTAICQATVTGERADDFIQVTMRLKQENVIWKTWYEEGYFQVTMEGSCKELIKNKVYTLEISATINGKPQEVLMVSKACTGVVPTEPTTQPTVPTAPTTQPTVPTTQPTVPSIPPVVGEDWEGFAFIFFGHQPTIQFEVDLSKLVKGHLYYVDHKTQKVTSICDETVVALTHDEFSTDLVYYVKRSEPTKIYQTNMKDPDFHSVIYESAFGAINDISLNPYTITKQRILQFVADNKYFAVLNMDTGETELVMEQYYMQSAFFEYGIHDTWNEHEYVLFYGKLSEDDKIKHYLYERNTGKVEAEEDEWSDG